MNYSSWVYYFSHLFHVYGIFDHLVDPVASSSTATPMDPPPKDAEWTKIDFIIRSWIFSTLAPSLRKRLVDLNPTTAKDAWTYIAGIFQDNKRPRAMALKAKLCNLKLGDLSIDGYFQKIASIISVLNGLGSPISNDDVVTFTLEGLPFAYETISIVIVSREPFPDLKTVRSLLTTYEMRQKSRIQNPLVDATFASPMGSCLFGDACNYLYNDVHGKSTLLPHTSGSASSVPDVTRSNLDIMQSLLAKFGLNAPNTSTPSPPVAYTVSVPPGFPSVSAQLSTQPTYHGVYYPEQGVQLLVHRKGFTLYLDLHSRQFSLHSQLFASGSQGLGQATLLPNAFNTTTLQDPAFDNWNMDTSESSHINDYVHCLSDILNMCLYPCIAVGDGRFILVTNSGHSILSTPFRPPHLNNVLITPNIVKNLIFICQFVRDNSCTVEFDPFGFSVKDFIIRRVLLRCVRTGDLYPVMKPSTIPHAFLTSQYTWHQRLRHPGSEVLRRLVSSDSISCNKEKLLVLCHACKLGKHLKLSIFKCEIKSFQCDHGGEFDNHAFHKLFHNNDTNHKLRPRATPSIFLGHAANHFGYHCLDLNTNKSIISCHVTFYETVFPFPSTKSTAILSYDFLDDSTDLISTIIRTAPITPVPAPVHTPQVDVPTPPTPPPPPTPQSVPQIIPKHAPTPTNDSLTVSIHPMVTRSRVGTTRPNPCYAGHVSTISPLPRSYKEAFNEPNYQNAMFDDQYKARLVTNGSTQVEGVDIDETFSLVVKPGTIWTVLSLAISQHWPIHQLDVKNAFLHGDLAKTVYMHQPTVTRDSSDMFLSQRKYAMEILEHAHMYHISTRPDITYDVQQGTSDYGLQLFSSTTDSLIAYLDTDWAGCPTTRRSTLGYCVFLGNNLLSWSSKRQLKLSRSSAEAGYRSVANAVDETWTNKEQRNTRASEHKGQNLANISAAEISDLKTIYEIELLTRLGEGDKANISNDSYVLRLKASTSGPLNKHSEKTENFHAVVSTLRSLEDDVALPVELAKARSHCRSVMYRMAHAPYYRGPSTLSKRFFKLSFNLAS
nr:ribonuclease H-like domain-containing protein [Tanacetum cinerariifolium]